MNITDYLPALNTLNSTDTPLKGLLNDTIGAFFDNFNASIDEFNYNLFIQNSTGFYLDLYGRDYNVPRLVDESDEHYRKRLITISSKHFTLNTLYDEYDLQLLTYNSSYNKDTMLVSDNHFLNNTYMVDCDDTTWNTIQRKYVTNIRRLL